MMTKQAKWMVGWAVWLCMWPWLLEAQTKELYIYHTNDVHSCIDPLPDNYPDSCLAGRGGAVRRAAFLQAERHRHPGQTLLFDAGDFSQGSPYYTLYRGEVEVRLMNAMAYDAVAIGNHEFDSGLDNMARIFKLATFPLVCANYHFEGTPLEGIVQPFVILQRNGLKIGVFGLGPELEGLVQEKCRQGVRYEDPVVAANRVSAQLADAGCDLVVCLSHLGWQGKVSDETLIPATRGIDVVLGGHSHSFFEQPRYYRNLDGHEIPLQQMGKHGAFVGKMKLTWERE